ncbi:MAG: hypothetical protein ABSF46_10635 [Terriglobia bacterium]|jgi:hypothetical protein
MINRFRKTATMATALFTVVLAAAAVTKAQGQGAAAPALSDAQAQARLQALLSQQASGQKLTPAQTQLLAQYLAMQSRASAVSDAQGQTASQGFNGQARGGATAGSAQIAPQALTGLAAMPPSAVGPKKPGVIRIGVTQPKAQMGQGNSGVSTAEPIRNMIMQYLTGPSQDVIPLAAMLPSQIDAEAKSKDCDYILYSTVSQKIGGGGLGALKKFGSMSSMIPGVGMATGTMTGVMAGAAAGSVIGGAASVAGTVKAKGVVTLEYKLVAPGNPSALVANSENLKAKEDGEDVISPLIEHAATTILNEIAKKK